MKREPKLRDGIHEIVVQCWCSKKQRRFGLVFESRDGYSWELRHAFGVNENYSTTEVASNIRGQFVGVKPSFEGCKICGNRDLFQCGECGGFSCHSSNFFDTVKCGKCGMKGQLVEGDIKLKGGTDS
jgi:hypothetical protein